MIKLHLGCGPHIIKDFLNYDLGGHPGAIQHDLTTKLPHPDDSVDYIFSEHFFEHITRDQGLYLLKECRRVLKPGCTLRITTPDLKVLVTDYINKKIDRWKGAWEPKTPAQMLNYGLTAWGHQFTYDIEELILIFKEAGFQSPESMPHSTLECRSWSCEITVEANK